MFSTLYKSIPFEFLIYKDSFPLRCEALTFISHVLSYSKEDNKFILYHELISSLKKNNLALKELTVLKNSVKGNKVKSVCLLLETLIINKTNDILNTYINEGLFSYIEYIFKKDNSLIEMFPEIKRFYYTGLKDIAN